MKKRLLAGLLAGLILAGALTVLASAHASPNFNLLWNAMTGGGGRLTSTNVAIEAALGQTAPGSAQITTGADAQQLVAGFYGPDLLSFTLFLPSVKR